MSASSKFDFKKKKQKTKKKPITFFWNTYTQKRPNFTCDNYIFPETRGNKNKQWTHSTPLKLKQFYLKRINKRTLVLPSLLLTQFSITTHRELKNETAQIHVIGTIV